MKVEGLSKTKLVLKSVRKGCEGLSNRVCVIIRKLTDHIKFVTYVLFF